MRLSTSILLVGALMLFACGGGDEPAGTGDNGSAEGLAGDNGLADGLAGDNGPGATPVLETELVVLDIQGMT